MINPCLPHAERVRLGLAPADPNYMPPDKHQPNTKIDAKRRSDAKQHLVLDVTTDDPVRTLSPAELDDLRFRMLGVQNCGSSASQLQAMRILTLIDQAEAATDYTDEVAAALDAANVEPLASAVDTAEEEIQREIESEWEDRLTDELGDLTTPADLKHAFKVWHAAELKRISDSIPDTFAPITKAVETTKAALERLE